MTRLQVLLNDDELEMFEEIKKYYSKLFCMKLSTSDILRFIIQKEWNWEHGIELEVSNKTDSSLNNSLTKN